MTHREKLMNEIKKMTDLQLAVKLCELIECDECPVVTQHLMDNRSPQERAIQQRTCCEANLCVYLKSKVKDD